MNQSVEPTEAKYYVSQKSDLSQDDEHVASLHQCLCADLCFKPNRILLRLFVAKAVWFHERRGLVIWSKSQRRMLSFGDLIDENLDGFEEKSSSYTSPLGISEIASNTGTLVAAEDSPIFFEIIAKVLCHLVRPHLCMPQDSHSLLRCLDDAH